MATPKRRMKAQNSLSEFDLGLKSPKPTVDREVNAKYIMIIVTLASVFPKLFPSTIISKLHKK